MTRTNVVTGSTIFSNAPAAREARRKARKAEAGLVQVQVWVHCSRRDDIRAAAETMRTQRTAAA